MTQTEDQRGYIPTFRNMTTHHHRQIQPPTIKKRQYNKENIDFTKRNKTSRQRGYALEYDIVQAFNQHTSKEWTARRLGGASSGLPDIVATNNEKSILYAIECKSGESNILYIPKDQIDRCKEITDKLLKTYNTRFVVFAFKFKGKKGTYIHRKLQYRFVLISSQYALPKHLKGVSYNIRTETLNTHESYKDYPICLPTLARVDSISNFVNLI